MKAEISRLKKKYQAEIAELEMTIDNLNRANIEAQKTIKKQSEQIKVRSSRAVLRPLRGLTSGNFSSE